MKERKKLTSNVLKILDIEDASWRESMSVHRRCSPAFSASYMTWLTSPLATGDVKTSSSASEILTGRSVRSNSAFVTVSNLASSIRLLLLHDVPCWKWKSLKNDKLTKTFWITVKKLQSNFLFIVATDYFYENNCSCSEECCRVRTLPCIKTCNICPT